MNCINEMKFEIISRSANEGFSRAAVAAFASQLDPTVDEICDIKTAVSEAVTNSIVHGYKDKIGRIFITAKIYDNGKLYLTIRDKGCGIEDIEKAKEPMYTTSTDGDRSGMGFCIMESFMDKLTVKSTPGKGTKITLVKKLNVKDKSTY